MIVFDELRVTKDAEYLIIDARVRKEDYYKDVYIDKIVIDTEETYSEGGQSSNPVYSYSPEGDNKSIRLILNINELQHLTSLKNHLLFVYAVAKGTPASNTPCGLDNINTLGVTTYMGDFYNYFMQNIKEVGQSCSVPQNFINALLRWEALNVSIDSGHYTQGIKYFNDWFKDGVKETVNVNCGCNG